ncbi:TatD family hydrolase [Thermogladius sp.]|jgi:TatD DNase family protein|uniref:TatD family hydrolase n=1 Tax=Thermogladius sp. TaxID=2023064 RepID=UPI003D0CB44E
MKIVDMHVHCHEMDVGELRTLVEQGYVLVCVSDDYESSLRTLELGGEIEVQPCIGLHPWEIGRQDYRRVVELVERSADTVKCLGEVGLDRQFVPETFERQLDFFKQLLALARDYGLVLNLHTPRAWREVYELLLRNDIEKAYFHWYTGPLDLMEEIQEKGYYVGLNPAFKIQDKHRRVLEVADLEKALTESDSPYEYKGLKLNPRLINETVDFLANTRGASRDYLTSLFYTNYLRLFG